jgi:transcriptional regulator with XRE-family HTH domain
MIYFNKNLIHFREKSKLTQKQLAGKLGVNLKTYQAWEEKRGFPKPGNLLKLCHVFAIKDLISFINEELYKERKAS